MSEIGSTFENDAVTDLLRELLEESDESASAYLMESWLASAVAALRDARRQAGLTQEDIAERLDTKQPAIARLERDHEGKFSLRRFAEYALACGVLPLDILLKPVEELREYALENPEASRTEKSLEAWHTSAANVGEVFFTSGGGESSTLERDIAEAFRIALREKEGFLSGTWPTDDEVLLYTAQRAPYGEPMPKENAPWPHRMRQGAIVAGPERRTRRLPGQTIDRDTMLEKAS